jgi:phosphoserine phosphatase
MLVSGGFTFFTERLKQQLGLDYAYANQLEVMDGKLTGRVVGDIVDAAAKQRLLIEKRSELGLRPEQVIAMGDGANDLLMLGEAGVGVAYRAKPVVQAKADVPSISLGWMAWPVCLPDSIPRREDVMNTLPALDSASFDARLPLACSC